MDVPLFANFTPDFRVFAFALLMSVVTTLLFGLLPAMQSTKTDLVSALKNEAASERSRYWHVRDYVVASQVGLSVLLLVCSVLVVRSLQRALHAPIGYNPEGAVTVSFGYGLVGRHEVMADGRYGEWLVFVSWEQVGVAARCAVTYGVWPGVVWCLVAVGMGYTDAIPCPTPYQESNRASR